MAQSPAHASPPVAGFQPMVGITLTDEFATLEDSLLFSQAVVSQRPDGAYVTGGDGPHFELALLDTGANG
ncbi:MAG: hypothetical protein AAF790_08050, partial [Planctomycetota bacterium]